ncbi:OPT superfamily oligopeptide transporter [Thozetella sp. PMI_491]|nr:OPT superfamily oligopeptide transporter [Thozetella sp. PMI_491]
MTNTSTYSGRLGISECQYDEVKRLADTYSFEDIRQRVAELLEIHENDPNFPWTTIEKLKTFLLNKEIANNPEKYELLIQEIKIETALICYNSPYSQVRAVVDNYDDVNTPSSTIRAWAIGLAFSVLMAFINQLFSIRQPAIHVGNSVAQLLAYPVGVAAARVLPDWGITVFGYRHSLNPGPFSKKEHMLITIMSSVGSHTVYTNHIIWVQYLPQYFNQSYAGQFAYQILIGLGTNFIGYGLAGICRRFLVYPSYCVWPQSLVTIALNSAFHDGSEAPVRGPWGKWITMTRYKFFLCAFSIMFVYFWFPNAIFQALSIFNWMSWIAPNNVQLNSIVGFNNGAGLNPIPTFDWNNIIHQGTDPLMLPFFTTLNKFFGSFISMFFVLGLWYSNAWDTGHLPLNSNRVYDHFGHTYNVSRAIHRKSGLFDAEKYEKYSPAFLAAGNITIYVFYFSIYTATLTYALLYQRREVQRGFTEVFNCFWKSKRRTARQHYDVHNRLMSAYKNVPEWWFAIVFLFALVCGIAGVVGWPTYTSAGVVFFGIALCVVFLVPIGVIKAMTGVEVNLSILAEFIGGSMVPGNALAMNYMKAYGYVTCNHAINFSNDLKLAHYIKIPPRQTFMVQMVATLVSTFVGTSLLNFQMNRIPGVCTVDAPYRFTCPHINSFFTASVLWGTIGPQKTFGAGGQYSMTLMGFPFGVVLAMAFWYAKRKFQTQLWLRQVHPVVILAGAIYWAPYNIGYLWPAVPIGWFSWLYIRSRYLDLWSKYNFVLSAALSTGIAISGIVMFFAIQWLNIKINWWGNTISYRGCEANSNPCVIYPLAKGEYFGPRVGEFH